MENGKKNFKLTIVTALAIALVGFFAAALILQPIFQGQVILPRYLNLGSLRLQFYGLIVAAAVLAGYWLVLRRRDLFAIEASDAETIFFIVLVSGFIGSRLYHVISEFGYYVHNISQVVAVWKGGLSIYGAALGGMLGLFLYLKITRKYSLLQLLDWLVPGLALGQVIGRFGNFVNYEIYGSPTELPWKMFVPAEFRTPPLEAYEFFHPLFLYEAAGSAAILFLLLRLKLQPGRLFLLWLFLYNVMRFFLEFLRVGSVTYGTVRVNALVSLVLIGIALYVWHRIKNSNNYAISNTPHS